MPENIGLIMDGNGRWAVNRGETRSAGHTAGIVNMITLVVHAFEMGVKNVICYGLSTENLKRPRNEVDHIFELIIKIHDYFITTFNRIGACVKYIGDLASLPTVIQTSLSDSEKELSKFLYNGKTLYVSIAYGGRNEIVNAVNTAVKNGVPVTEEQFMSLLSVPIEPDLIIRTGGERRLSNFLLYQASYSELFFSDKLFPDFNADDLDAALEWYASRRRTYGNL